MTTSRQLSEEKNNCNGDILKIIIIILKHIERIPFNRSPLVAASVTTKENNKSAIIKNRSKIVRCFNL